MAISYEPELLLARDQGLKLVSIGALVQRPLTSIIALGNQHVARPADLAGKRVGTAGIDYQSAELKTMLQAARVDPAKVQETNVGFNLVPAMLSRKVAATLGGFWNYEGDPARAGAPAPGRDPGRPGGRAHLQRAGAGGARRRGAHAGPGPARLPAGADPRRAGGQGRPRRRRQARASRPIRRSTARFRRCRSSARCRRRFPPTGPSPLATRTPASWAAFAQWMASHQLVRSSSLGGLPPFTNEFLPGQGD